MNDCNPKEHVPRVERNNRIIGERIHSRHYHLLRNRLRKTLVKYLVIESAKKLSFFLAQSEASKHFSSKIIVH